MSVQWYEGAVKRYHENPLSVAEVDALARRAQRGDRRAREAIVEALAGIAEVASSKQIKLAQYRGLERDDLRQEAMAAILKALETWREDVATFRTYAFDRARYAVSDAVNRAHVVTIPKQYADPAARGSEDKNFNRLSPATKAAAKQAVQPVITLAPATDDEVGCDPGTIERGYEETINRITVEQILSNPMLPQRHKQALIARVVEGEKLIDIARILRVSPERARKIVNRAKEIIRMSNSTRASRRMAS